MVGTRLATKNTSASADVPKKAAMIDSRKKPRIFPIAVMAVTIPAALTIAGHFPIFHSSFEQLSSHSCSNFLASSFH